MGAVAYKQPVIIAQVYVTTRNPPVAVQLLDACLVGSGRPPLHHLCLLSSKHEDTMSKPAPPKYMITAIPPEALRLRGFCSLSLSTAT